MGSRGWAFICCKFWPPSPILSAPIWGGGSPESAAFAFRLVPQFVGVPNIKAVRFTIDTHVMHYVMLLGWSEISTI